MIRSGPAAVIIPTLDEAAHIEALLQQLIAEPPEAVGEILIADGGSTDGTTEIVRRVAARDPRIRLVDNEHRLQAAGINLAASLARPDLPVLIRVDAHAGYPADYAARLLDSMARSDADSVVVRLTTIGETRLQRAIAAAQNSLIGTGGAAHRIGATSRFVDHGHHAAFRRTLFEQLGGYDRNFEANEDAELDYRIRAAGGRIWLDTDIPVHYYPRRSLSGLWRQYRRYGSGRARNHLKNGERLRIRQLLPPLAVMLAITGLLLAPWFKAALVLPMAYFLLLASAAFVMALRKGTAAHLLAAPALATMHFAWAFGFLRMLIFPTRPVIARGPLLKNTPELASRR